MAARLTLLFALAALVAWAAGGHASPSAAPSITLADGAFSQSNSRDGQAILSASGMAPGASVEGTVTVGNNGSTYAGFTLVRGAVSDQPGAGGGRLSDRLQLRVDDLSAGRLIYAGRLIDMSPPSLGRFGPGESHSFRFRVTLPDGGPAADNAYAGSAASIRFDWLAQHDDVPKPPTQPGPGQGADPPPPPPPPTAAMAPRLTLTAKGTQRVLRQRGAIVTAVCDQACTLRADGSLTAKTAKARAWTMTPQTAKLAAGGRAKLKLKLSKGAKRALASALKRRRKVKLSVRVTATGASGKSTTVRRSIRVKR
jgi:hypothetical protein